MERLPYAQRMRNRCIAITVLITIIVAIVHCSTKEDLPASNVVESNLAPLPDSTDETIAANDTNAFYDTTAFDTAAANPNGLAALKGIEDEDFENAKAKDDGTVSGNAAAHIKSQKDPYLAEKIDILLHRYRPDLGVILVVDTRTNEIIAWGERRDDQVQSKPDYIGRATFPAASLAKLVTISAAMESNRYSLNTPIPMIGRHHTLYLRQLRVPEKYNGPTMELSEAFARSANPPMAIVGKSVGAKRLTSAAAKLGYNRRFPGNAPNASSYTAPDTGYGLAEAATTLVGQSTGARRRDLCKRFAHITVTLGVLSMTTLGVLMYIFAPQMMSIMSPVQEIVDLGAQCLRIEAWAEPLFGASIVCYGVMVGAGDTLIPSAMNLGSMWVVRITLAALLAPALGLKGVWIAMCIELWVRGIIFLARLWSGRWAKKSVLSIS